MMSTYFIDRHKKPITGTQNIFQFPSTHSLAKMQMRDTSAKSFAEIKQLKRGRDPKLLTNFSDTKI